MGHLRALETPLSAVATATSPAETDPAMAKSIDAILSRNDPLNITSEALKLGYAYSTSKQQVSRPAVQRRKSSSAKETVSSPVTTKVTKRRQSFTSPSNLGTPKLSANSTSANTTKIDSTRKRKSMTQSESSTTPRTVQRKRASESSRQISVDDKAFQPRPIMTQPQQQAIRPIPQFFPQMNQQQFSQQAMQIPGQVVGPQGAMPQNPVRQNMPSTDEQNDPLFMLKEM